MNEVFSRGPSQLTRLMFVVVLSLAAMFADSKIESVSVFRAYLTSLVSPLQYVANMPGQVLNWGAKTLNSRSNMLEENERLLSQITLMSEQLQRFTVLQQENKHLRTLLDAPVEAEMKKVIAELMAVDNNPYSHQVIINKGALDDVYAGQAVLDESGILGQVIEVGTTNSRVLLLSDVTHAIPTRVSRNNVKLVVSGIGELSELSLEHVPHSTDIIEGDMLVSSGLGKVFPKGYPVGTITKIVRDEGQPFAQVTVVPAARIDRIKYVLLLWPEDIAPQQSVSSEEIIQMFEPAQ